MPPAPVDRRRIFVRAYLGQGRARWGCFAADHTWTDFVLPTARMRRASGDPGARLMARWWRRESGGVSGRCPRCAKKKTPTV